MATRGSVAALLLAAAGAVVTSCGGDEFCAEGSYECSTDPTAGMGGGSGSTGTGGTAASETGGSSAQGGTAGSGSGGLGGTSGTTDGGTAGGAGASGSGDTGGGGAAGSGDAGPVTCDANAPVAGCVPTAKGIFVASAGGDDENKGTSDKPYKTLGKAIVAAAESGAPIFVCAGTYEERLVVKTTDIELHGGYTCTGFAWEYDANQAKIAPTVEGQVLKLDGADGFTATDLEITAQDATGAGESSVAVFVKDSNGVTLTRVHLVAGTGADGEEGVYEEYGYPEAVELNGNEADGDVGGAANNKCTCEGPGPQSIGAPGGAATQDGGRGQPTELGGGEPGKAGKVGPDEPCSNGGPGNDAATVADGDGAQALGVISSSGWTPEGGQEGANGAPGQGGGGGGGAAPNKQGAGGGGACGGCGGKGGSGGGGGGASVALLVLRSQIDVVDSKLETSDAGRGGPGAAGQPGQDGGTRGKQTDDGCLGGSGGKGADGGGAGGGAGGVSVGILQSASTVGVNPATIIWIGKLGAGGPGGGADNAGIDGVAEKRQTL